MARGPKREANPERDVNGRGRPRGVHRGPDPGTPGADKVSLATKCRSALLRGAISLNGIRFHSSNKVLERNDKTLTITVKK
jgi:hypothetical protein